MTLTHQQIVEKLRDEALNNIETGWLSDMFEFNLEYFPPERSIDVGFGQGSIDLGHLASIVAGLIEEARAAAWDEAVYHLEPIMGKDARIIGMNDNPYRKKN